MWYFTWILGLGFALAFSLINTIWHDTHLIIEDQA